MSRINTRILVSLLNTTETNWALWMEMPGICGKEQVSYRTFGLEKKWIWEVKTAISAIETLKQRIESLSETIKEANCFLDCLPEGLDLADNGDVPCRETGENMEV